MCMRVVRVKVVKLCWGQNIQALEIWTSFRQPEGIMTDFGVGQCYNQTGALGRLIWFGSESMPLLCCWQYFKKFFAKNYLFHACALVSILSLFLNTVAKIQKARWKKQRQKKQTTQKHKIIMCKSGKKEHSGSWQTLLNRVWVSSVPIAKERNSNQNTTIDNEKQRLPGSGRRGWGLQKWHF